MRRNSFSAILEKFARYTWSGRHSPAGYWRFSIARFHDLASRTPIADLDDGITRGSVLRRKRHGGSGWTLENDLAATSATDDMAATTLLLLLSVLYVGSLHAIPGRLNGTCGLVFSRLPLSGVVHGLRFVWTWRGVICFRRLVDDFREWFHAVIVIPGTDQSFCPFSPSRLFPMIQAWDFLFCLALFLLRFFSKYLNVDTTNRIHITRLALRTVIRSVLAFTTYCYNNTCKASRLYMWCKSSYNFLQIYFICFWKLWISSIIS